MSLALMAPLQAEAKETPVVDALKSMEDNLAALSGKSVSLHLSNGHTVSGKVAEVGAQHVRIAEISGKEYFDALVRIDSIVALEVRARGG
ncbi:hypothetical protein [Pseudomarimonas arenosa]|uniref:Uncharacterized protein n=1 Tax=Pseudomarimonas arenosa TaxID=2774145 RepID=A0AAW3ZSV3_9GAMM|nr:hypothetical protein [Pseudomarimonas arenosa]MBD8527246.1 hypothetical protein [Pseudomarimonas arenosa]